MRWLNPPPKWSARGASLSVDAAPKTYFWRTTHTGHDQDNGPFYYRDMEGDSLARVRLSGAYREPFDQAGLMIRLDQVGVMVAAPAGNGFSVVFEDLSIESAKP